MAATQPNTAKMRQWLRPGGLYGPDAFKGILDAQGRPLSGGKSSGKSSGGTKSTTGKGKTTKKRRTTSSGSGGTNVRAYRTRSGRRVRAYKRGTSQSEAQVRQRGLVWGGQVFHSRSQFARSLQHRGTSINVFARRHRAAYRGLTTTFTHTPRSR